MRKTLLILLIFTLLMSLAVLPAHAAGAAKIIDYADYLEESGETLYGCFDNILVDGGLLHEDGKGNYYLDEHNNLVVGPYATVGVAGWMASTVDIQSFGYTVDDGEPVLSAEFMAEGEEGVMNAAQAIGCEYAKRYYINIDVTQMTGMHKFTFLIQLADGSIVTLSGSSQYDVWINYAPSADEVPKTPEPTFDPDASGAKGIVFEFVDEALLDGEFFAGSKNNISEIYYDDEKKCYVMVLDGEIDPYVSLPFGLLSSLDEAYTVDCAECAYMQIGTRFDAPNIGEKGQFFFQTDEYTGIDEVRDVPIKWKNTAEKQYVNVNLGKHKHWKGLLIDCRLDPQNPPKSECEMEFYYIAFFPNEQAANAFGDKWLETGVLDVPTPAPTPTKAPTEQATQVPTPVPTEAPAVSDVPVSEPTQAPSGDNTGTGDDKSVSDNKSTPWLVIGIVAGVLVIAAIVIALVIASKKKKKK